MTLEDSCKIIEGLLFAAPQPITLDEMSQVMELEPEVVARLLERVRERYNDSGLMIRQVAGGFQFVTRPELAGWIDKLGRPVISTPLTVAGLETLAIIAYQQPITRVEIEQIRGVRVDSPLYTLLERELIMEVGRKDGPGRPILYGTTEGFLINFGLASLNDLPPRPDFPKLAEAREQGIDISSDIDLESVSE